MKPKMRVGVNPKGRMEEALDITIKRRKGKLIPVDSGPFVSCTDVPVSWIEPSNWSRERGHALFQATSKYNIVLR